MDRSPDYRIIADIEYMKITIRNVKAVLVFHQLRVKDKEKLGPIALVGT